MLNAQYGHIGAKEISEAISIFEDIYMLDGEVMSDCTSLYIERRNTLTVGIEFDDISTLLDDGYISVYDDLPKYLQEVDHIDSNVIGILKAGKIAYIVYSCGCEYVGEDLEPLVISAIKDGEAFIYTLKEALENLQGIGYTEVNEALVVWLLEL